MAPYLFLSLAIGAELLATSLIKSTEGFTKLGLTLLCLLGYAVSFAALAQAVKVIPVSVAYAVWSGLGTAAVAAIGAVFLDEPITAVKLAGLSLVVAGVVLLNLQGASA